MEKAFEVRQWKGQKWQKVHFWLGGKGQGLKEKDHKGNSQNTEKDENDKRYFYDKEKYGQRWTDSLKWKTESNKNDKCTFLTSGKMNRQWWWSKLKVWKCGKGQKWHEEHLWQDRNVAGRVICFYISKNLAKDKYDKK